VGLSQKSVGLQPTDNHNTYGKAWFFFLFNQKSSNPMKSAMVYFSLAKKPLKKKFDTQRNKKATQTKKPNKHT